jgi:ABC-2 type transport system ATP-binding protein
MLKLEKVSKDYGNGKGVKNISFQISRGKVCALLGHNGCGKTTTFRLLLGLLKEDEGCIYYDKELLDRTNYRLFGYIPEERSLLRGLNVEEHVFYLARLKKMEDPEIENALTYWLKFLQIEQYRKSKIIELSKGNQQKVQILCALIHNPEVIIFDEPLNGLDIDNLEIFKRLLVKLKNDKKIILISSHQYQNIEPFCEQVVYLSEGNIVLKGDIYKMKMKSSKRILTIKTKKEIFKKEEGILSSLKEKEYQVIEVENKQIGYTLIQKLIEMQIEEFKMELIPLSMIIKEKVV